MGHLIERVAETGDGPKIRGEEFPGLYSVQGI